MNVKQSFSLKKLFNFLGNYLPFSFILTSWTLGGIVVLLLQSLFLMGLSYEENLPKTPFTALEKSIDKTLVEKGEVFENSSKPISVIATTTIAADLLKKLGGEKVVVDSLMGVGVDPHNYIASEGDLRKILHADVVFYHGLNLEAKMTDVFASMDKNNFKKAHDLSQSVDKKKIIMIGNHPDPHLWFDISLWKSVAKGASQKLIELDTANKAYYASLLKNYLANLDHLEKDVKSLFFSIPKKDRVLITSHDAFSYFARAYGFQVLSARGINTQSQASTRDLQKLVKQITTYQARAFFLESSVSPKELYAIQSTLASEGYSFSLGGKLYSDSLGSDPVNSYEKVFYHNASAIALALQKKQLTKVSQEKWHTTKN